METRANYVMIGAFTLLSFLGAAIFAVWIANVGLDRSYTQYDVNFEGPVRGLAVGGEVRFNGIQVGEVVGLELDPADPKDVVARIRIRSETPVKVDSVAQLEPAGLTGTAYVQILAGSESAQLLRPRLGQARAVLASRVGTLDRLVQGSEGVVQNAVESLVRFNLLLDDENLEAISRTLANVERASARISERGELLDEAELAARAVGAAGTEVATLARSLQGLSEVSATYGELGSELLVSTRSIAERTDTLLTASGTLVDSLNTDLTGLVRDTRTTVTAAQATLGEIDETARSLRTVTDDIGTAAVQVAETSETLDTFFTIGIEQTLPDINRASQAVRATSVTFDMLAQQVQNDPGALVAQPPDQTVRWRQ